MLLNSVDNTQLPAFDESGPIHPEKAPNYREHGTPVSKLVGMSTGRVLDLLYSRSK